jgi:tyrosine-specific transport protein
VGRLAGGILLIVGTSIGGGMLALPMVSVSGGFWSSTFLLIGCWAVMTLAALFILEVNLWLPPRNNLISMAKATLGVPGAVATWVSYILLLYALLCAYISGGSELFDSFSKKLGLNVPAWCDSVLFVLLFGYIVYQGIRFVDYANRALMIAKFASLFAVIFFSFPYIEKSHVLIGDPRLVFGATTVMLTSFGFANIIPSLRSYFNDDVKSLRKAVLIGSCIPLICYILWNFAIIGALPREELLAVTARGGSVAELTELLSMHLNNPSITVLASLFTTICVLTAFLCVALALSDFLADGLKIEKKGRKGNAFIYGLTFLPSLLIVIFFPSIFVKALSYAGIFCVILIILLPALMVFSGRYVKKIAKGYQVIGGKISIVGIVIISLVMIALGIKEIF